MRLPRRPVLLLVMVAPVLIMPACDYIRSSVDPNLRLRVKNQPPPPGLNCIDNVRLVDQTTQAEYCVLKTPDPTRQQTQLTCHTGPVTPSTSCNCGQECGSIPGRKKRESERIMGGSNVTGNCVHPWQVSLTVNLDSVQKRLSALVEVYKDRLEAQPLPSTGNVYGYLTERIHTMDGHLPFCGGSIISPNYVITAAACLFWSSPVPGLNDFNNMCPGWSPHLAGLTGCLDNLRVPEHLMKGLLYGGLNIPLLPEEIAVLAGVNDLNTALKIDMALFNSFKYDIEGIKIHENYNQFMQGVGVEFKEYDIAILTVKTPFRISNTVRPVCLPSGTSSVGGTITVPEYLDKPATATGFGEKGRNDKSGLLKNADMKVVKIEDCNAKWRAVRSDPNPDSWSHGPYHDLNWPVCTPGIDPNCGPIKSLNHVCASAIGVLQTQPGGPTAAAGTFTSLCNGDEGGPLIIDENGRRTLIGIFSFADYGQSPVGSGHLGISCKPETPQVFTAVAPLVDWINENTKGKGITPWNSNCQGHELGCVTYAHLQTLAGSG